MTVKKLTPKERKFVSGILKGKSQTKAAIDAGIPEKRARQQGCRMRTNANIAEAIEKGQKKREERLQLSEDYELKNFMDIFDVSRQNFVDEDGYYNTGAVNNAINAMDKIVKMRGKYNTKVDLEVHGDLASLVGRLNDD